ncbi:MAG: hypothetical protein ISR69_01255 [Gammaproteobacteria bacterium]|nr:hypothetical protein [Gammaproteobacteria bacterium]
MIWAILGLSAGFIFVVSLLYFVLLKTQVSVLSKLLVLVFSAAFFLVQYQSLKQYMGWPSADKLPAEFVLISTYIREPNRQTGDAGIMYWWVRESADSHIPPRVYELPFKKEMKKKTEDVIKQQKQGAQFIGKKPSTASSKGSEGVSFEKISKSATHTKN